MDLARSITLLLDDPSWVKASLPLSRGGLGLRRAKELAFSVFLTSNHFTCSIVSVVFADFDLQNVVALPSRKWSQLSFAEAPVPEHRSMQRDWDQPVAEAQLRQLLTFADLVGRTRLRTALSCESGSWLHALPVQQLSIHFNDTTLRIAMALRLDSSVSQPHHCDRCQAPAGTFGHNGLSCAHSAGRHPRHSAFNEIIRPSLLTACLQAVREPPSLDRHNGKWVDGMTQLPWTRGNISYGCHMRRHNGTLSRCRDQFTNRESGWEFGGLECWEVQVSAEQLSLCAARIWDFRPMGARGEKVGCSYREESEGADGGAAFFTIYPSETQSWNSTWESLVSFGHFAARTGVRRSFFRVVLEIIFLIVLSNRPVFSLHWRQ